MLLQRSIYKTILVLISIIAFSTVGFSSIVRGYGSADNGQTEGATTGSGGNNLFLWILGIVILLALLYLLFLYLRRRGKK